MAKKKTTVFYQLLQGKSEGKKFQERKKEKTR
jgi:hypothetical protein